MNSLSLGFFYICGLSWLLCETCVSASNGNWTPLILFLVLFVLMFAILGCLPISAKAVDTAGPVFAVLIGAGIIAYGVTSFDAGFFGAAIRILGGGVVAAFGVLGILSKSGQESH